MFNKISKYFYLSQTHFLGMQIYKKLLSKQIQLIYFQNYIVLFVRLIALAQICYMKKLFILGLIFFVSAMGFAQYNLSLNTFFTPEDNDIPETYHTEKTFSNAKNLSDHAKEISDHLTQQGYLSHRSKLEQVSDSAFALRINLGKRIKYTKVHQLNAPEEAKAIITADLQSEEGWMMPYVTTEDYLNSWLRLFETNGYPMAEIQLSNQQISNDTLIFALDITLNKARTLDAITIQPYEKFPNGYRKQLEKRFLGKSVSAENLASINEMIEQFHFVRTQKPAEILFTEDQTALYLYLEKSGNNRLEGIIGFATDEEEKVRFNGNADIELNNVLNWGERFNIYWKSDGNQQSTFKANISVPYIFKSPMGIDAGMEIFRQDSTQQNTMLNLAALYHINYQNKIGVGYQSTSSVAGEQNLYSAENYTNRFVLLKYQFEHYRTHFLFPLKTMVSFNAGLGNRQTDTKPNASQYFFQLNAQHIIDLNQRNNILLKSEVYYLQSDEYLYNELYRFGGIHSIRGFSENSLTTNFLGGLYTEYRYLLTGQIYAHTITDFAYYNDPMADFNGLLYSFGLGIGIDTPGGLFNLIYANGIQPESSFKLSNSMVHLSFKTRF